MFPCPNPRCHRNFLTGRGVGVHIGKSERCRRWRAKYLRSDTGIRVSTTSPPTSGAAQVAVEYPPFWITGNNNDTSSGSSSSDSEEESDGVDSDGMEEPSNAGSPPPNPPRRHSTIRKHPRAGFDYGKGRTILEEIDVDHLEEERRKNRYHPFASKEDFEVGAWFIKSSVSMSDIDLFLNLSFFKNSLSFRSAKDLHDKIAMLPKPPPWKMSIVSVGGGTTRKPIKFFYRDAFDVFRFEFGNPLFANHQTNVPVQVWKEGNQIFEGPMTGNLASEIQDKIGEGETLGLVILGSDKTGLNRYYGDKQAHCVYMSCGNVSKELRTKESARCWVKIAEIPVVKFLEKKYQGLLSQRLFHLCMGIVTEGLKVCSHEPVEMVDAGGVKRLVRTILLAHISDYPEQQLIACVQKNYSPVSTAYLDEFGSPQRQPPRTKRMTLGLIKRVLRSPGMTARKLARYKALSLKLGLNGVHKPFWWDWKFADPYNFLAPDALHQWHKFFQDHIIAWAKAVLGKNELDGRYALLQKRVGLPHFSAGFTKFSQHTCRESRELQRSFIAVISGHRKLEDSAMLAFRGLLEFIYYAQFDSLSSDTLLKLENSLSLFHDNKASLSFARSGPNQNGEFHIPKLELMQHVAQRARLLGSLAQYSSEQTERCHITMAKEPYRATNRKNYEEQVCRYLDRHEKIALFSLYLERKELVDHFAQLPRRPLDETEQLNRALEEKFLPRPVRNWFLCNESHVPRSTTTAFVLTDRITYGNMNVSEISNLYDLPLFRSALELKFHSYRVRNEGHEFPFQVLDCWDRVRLQLLRNDRDHNEALQPQTLMASPPSLDYPSGHCHFVFVKPPNGVRTPTLHGHLVAQLRVVFQPVYSDRNREAEYFAYIELFEPASDALVEDGIHMKDPVVGLPRVMRSLEQDGSRRGCIVNIQDIWRPIDLVPVFGKRHDDTWDHFTSTEEAAEFYVNYYCDKNTFKDMY